MPDPKSIAAWCAVPAAIGGALLYVGAQIDVRAQEAAKKEVEVQMAPVQQSLDELVEQGRRREDREAFVFCLDRQHQDLDADDRQRLCQDESDHRWELWAWEDCMTVNGADVCGDKP